MNKDPLADIDNADADALIVLVDRLIAHREKYPDAEILTVPGFSPEMLAQAKLMLARLDNDSASPKAKRKHRH